MKQKSLLQEASCQLHCSCSTRPNRERISRRKEVRHNGCPLLIHRLAFYVSGLRTSRRAGQVASRPGAACAKLHADGEMRLVGPSGDRPPGQSTIRRPGGGSTSPAGRSGGGMDSGFRSPATPHEQHFVRRMRAAMSIALAKALRLCVAALGVRPRKASMGAKYFPLVRKNTLARPGRGQVD